MISRQITKKFKELQKFYPVLSVVGPRQSGKTTLVKKICSDYTYVNLESLDILQAAQNDPRSFLKIGSGERMVIDEIQRFPDLLSYIQVEVDAMKIPGQFVVTGSQSLNLSEKVGQSLSGRAGNLTLLPLSVGELRKADLLVDSFSEMLLKGFYPRVFDTLIPARDFYRDYLFSYVERDVRQLKNIGDLSTFQRFIQLMAGRVGQIVNLSSLANDIGVSYKTIESWISVLEASYVLFRLQPYYRNLGKRVVKSPKVYFYDVGLLAYLLGIDSQDELFTHYALGGLFENLVIADVAKGLFNFRSSDKIFYWRDSVGNEIDLLVDHGSDQTAVELKAGRTFSVDMLKGLDYWRTLPGVNVRNSLLVYTGDHEQKVHDHRILNWLSLDTFLKF